MPRTLLILTALLLNAFILGPRGVQSRLGIAHILRLPVQGIRDIERRLNRDNRSADALVMRGWVFALFVVCASLIFGLLVGWILQGPLQTVEIVLLALMLPFRSTLDLASAIRKHLRSDNIAAARSELEYSIWRHHARLDDNALARAAIETLAVHFAEKIVAPVLFYILLGLPGLFASKTLYLMQETLVRATENEQAFARGPRRLHFLLHYLTSRIAAFMWLCAAIFIPSADFYDSMAQVFRGTWKERPQDIALLAAASVLHVSLGGPMSAYVHEGWIGGGTAKLTQADVGRAMRLFVILHLLLFSFLGLFV